VTEGAGSRVIWTPATSARARGFPTCPTWRKAQEEALLAPPGRLARLAGELDCAVEELLRLAGEAEFEVRGPFAMYGDLPYSPAP